ncbi:Met18p [Nakaseomyces bracarensis]|uniref:Met18p n=1 Tax=Nakaseomyces bracarensis TaxID=273131 RepID=UPI00387287A0
MNSEVLTFMANAGVNDDKAVQSAIKLAEKISNKEMKLLDIIVNLKDYIVSEDKEERKKSILCLNGTISNLPEGQLTKNEVTVLFQFFQSKMDDPELTKEVLNAFMSLSKFSFFNQQDASNLLEIILNKYDPRSFLAGVRYNSFLILDSIFKRFENQLQDKHELADLFIRTFLHIATGEKDPRNLLSSFKLNKLIASNLTKNAFKYAEKLFDVLFCYFPITFKPPKNDPYKITNTDLKLALRAAISANPIYVEDAFGNLIDKLSASSPAVKHDTLLTMTACIESFKGEACLKHWKPLWNALKFEIMQNNDSGQDTMLDPVTGATIQNEIKSNYQTALEVLKILAVELEQFDQNAFVKYFNYILEELKNNFKYQKDMKQSCNILASIASANEYTFNVVISGTLPLFVENTSETTKLKYLIMNLSFFFSAYMNVFGTATKETLEEDVSSNKLQDYKDELLMILGMALTSSSKLEVTIRTLSIIQFTKMAKMKGYLKREEVALIVQYITDTILTDSNKNIYHACLEGLKCISDLYEDIVYEVALTRMLNLLPETMDETAVINDEDMVLSETFLKIILDFTTSRHILVKESIIELSNKLIKSSQSSAARAPDFSFLVLSTLYSLYDNNYFILKGEDGSYLKNEVEKIYFSFLSGHNNILDDDLNLSLLSNILFFMNLCSSTENHGSEINKYYKTFIEEKQINKISSRLSLTYAKLLAGLSKDIHFMQSGELLKDFISLLLSQEKSIGHYEKLGYLEIILIVVNKWLTDEDTMPIFDWNNHSYINVEVMTWISKALISRTSPNANVLLKRFIELLSDPTVGTAVSKLFEIFVVDFASFRKYKGITWNNNIKLLYKQKTFSEIFQTLVALYKHSNDMDVKCNYLTALSLVLKHTPSELVSPYMTDLLPLLLQALEMPNSEVRLSALDTLKDSTEQHHQLVAEHIQSLVPLLLKLVKADEFNSVMIRLGALQLLQLLTVYLPLNYCLNYKTEIINGLLQPLSDKKRVVRKQCIDTRQAYFELGQVPFE